MRPAVVLLAAALLHAADAPEVRIRSGPYAFPQITISADATLVLSGVTVRDSRGQPVAGLYASDFEVLDDGRPQTITYFSAQTAALPSGSPRTTSQGASPSASETPALAPTPRSLALFFDDTHATVFDCGKAVHAAEKVLAATRPADRIALFTGSGEVTVDFTSDRQKLRAALARIKPRWSRRQLDPCVTLDPYQAYAIAHNSDYAEYKRALALAIACNCPSDDPECVRMQPDWVRESSNDSWALYRAGSEQVLDVLRIAVYHLAAMPESRVLVLLSRGFVTGDMEPEKTAIVNAALRSRIVLNALSTQALDTDRSQTSLGRQSVTQQLMAAASAATGGRFIKNTNDIDGALQTLSAPPEASYILGFTPSRDPDDKFHTLKVHLKHREGYHIEARPGYWSEKPKPSAEPAQRRIDDAVLSAQVIRDFPVTLNITPSARKTGAVIVNFRIDPRPLHFLKSRGRFLQQLTFVAVLENPSGNYLAGKQSVMDLVLTPPKLASMSSTGIGAVLTFRAAPGRYAIRTVVREAAQNRIAATTATFTVP